MLTHGFQYFKTIFLEPTDAYPFGLQFPGFLPFLIDNSDNESILKCPGEEEVRRSVLAIISSKASGPDVFNYKFFQDFWACIKKYRRAYVGSFLRQERLWKLRQTRL